MNNFISPLVSKKAIDDFFKKCIANGDEIQALEIFHDNQMVVRYAISPYDCEEKAEFYSVSKTFASTAVGLAHDEGLLSVDERIIDIFPDKLPDEVSSDLSDMTIEHLLTMSTGHSGCVMGKIFTSDDPVKEFLAKPLSFPPGTHFAYNTAATFMLSAIVQRKTGETLFDYLNRKLFGYIGIKGVRWNSLRGMNEGGVGIQASTDDLAKLMLLYYNKGVVNGKFLLSEKWIAEATSPKKENNKNGTPDWTSGYGYQIWINSREGYRADGAFGQLGVVFPSKKLVIVVRAETCGGMQPEMERLYDLADNLFKKDSEEFDVISAYPPLPAYSGKMPGYLGKYYIFGENPLKLTNINLRYEDQRLVISLSDGDTVNEISAGNGFYDVSELYASNFKPKLFGMMVSDRHEKMKIASCFAVDGKKITVFMRHLSCPNTEVIEITELEKGQLTVSFKSKCGVIRPEASGLTARLKNR